MNGDVLFPVFGIVLVAGAAAFALLPLARAGRSVELPGADAAPVADRFALYRQVLELEFDVQLGKLSVADYEVLSSQLLADAGVALRAEKGTYGELDAEIEREIAAARAAFAAARAEQRTADRQAEPRGVS